MSTLSWVHEIRLLVNTLFCPFKPDKGPIPPVVRKVFVCTMNILFLDIVLDIGQFCSKV